MRRGIKNNLSKTFILSKVSQELIFSKYTGIPIEIINKCVTENSLICSPFRMIDILLLVLLIMININ